MDIRGGKSDMEVYTELNVLRDYPCLSINYCSIFSSAPLRSVLWHPPLMSTNNPDIGFNGNELGQPTVANDRVR